MNDNRTWLQQAFIDSSITHDYLKDYLGVSKRTVANYLTKPYTKLNLRTFFMLFDLLEENGYTFVEVLEGVTGTKHKGKARMWFNLDNDEYEN